MKFVRDPNVIYTIMDFEDGEEIEFAYAPDKPSAVNKGYECWKSKVDGRIRLLTQEEINRCKKENNNDC